MKFFQWEPSCFIRADRQTGRQADNAKLLVAFHNFVTAPNENVQS